MADLLESRIEALSDTWSARVGKTATPGFAPNIIRGLIASLRKDDSGSVKSGLRGQQRRDDGFDLDSLVQQYGQLRGVVHDLLDEQNWALTLSEARVLSDYFSSTIATLVERDPLVHALRASESRYRTLFESIDDGFCVIELHFDEKSKPIDYRFITTNRAFESHTGLINAQGKTALEMVPNLDASWFELYGNVALTGQPTRFENHAPAMKRWFEVYANRIGEPEARQVALVFKDITARKEGEELLAKAFVLEQKARSEAEAQRRQQHEIFMQAPVAISILDGPEHTFVFANPSYRALVGGRDVIGKPLFEALPEVREGNFHTLLDEVMKTRVPYIGKEVPITLNHHRPGEALILNFVYVPKLNALGEVDGVLMSGVDVTEQVLARRRVEALAAEVAASETRLRLVTDALPVLVSLVTRDEEYGFANKAYDDWFGIPAAKLYGRKVREVIGEQAYEVLGPYVRRGIAGETLSFEQYGVPYRHGGSRDVRVSFTPHFDANGERNGYVALLEDITVRRRLEAERDLASAQRTEVLESIADPFVALDSEDKVVLINARFERLAGITRADALGQNFWSLKADLAGPQSKHRLEYERCMKTREPVSFVEYNETLKRWSDVKIYPTGHGGIAVFYRDVSNEKRGEETLRRQSEFEQQMIGIVSHDLRNPLNAINLGTSALTRGEQHDERTLKTVLRIQTSAKRAIRMVEDLLDFTQARLGGGIPVTRKQADLHDVARAVCEEIETTYADRQVVLRHSGDGRGHFDPDRLGQVVQNLVTNAIKYSADKTPITVTTSGDANQLTLRVHNEGAPIAESLLGSLFNPMQRGTSEVSRANRSVGLGLYIVRSILEAHAGSVDVRSTLEDGTTFTVSLPRVR